MASGQQRLVVLLLLFFLVVSTTAVPTARSLKEVKNQVSLIAKLQSQDVKEMDNTDELQKLDVFMEGRMNVELADYKPTEANPKHNPTRP
ncbi:hypothetical protein PHJA_000476700 [Phtheirospermum japonicum]|uniref:Uncharacterized protein n=1 Tax=Phtheirospermum japonicum TaxID=374723 RepID=A0A830BGJ9_9LAMI|nr:hypothetical protein PHJA_000476700 [Phtheirospermum japonicum]